MEEQIIEQTPEVKVPRWKIHFWPVIVAILLTTILLSAFGWYWIKQSDKKQKALESYIQFLQNPNKNLKTN